MFDLITIMVAIGIGFTFGRWSKPTPFAMFEDGYLTGYLDGIQRAEEKTKSRLT